MAEVLKPGVVIKPQMDKEKAIEWIQEIYGLKAVNVKEFISYDDRNFYFKVDKEAPIENEFIKEINEDGYTLKVTNSLDSKDVAFTEAQNEMILHMDKFGLEVPVPVKNKTGTFLSKEKLPASGNNWEENNDENSGSKIFNEHSVRLLKFVKGKTLYEIRPWLPRHFFEAGVFCAKMDSSLKTFHHSAYDTRNSIWFLSSMPQVKKFLNAVQDLEDQKMCRDIIDSFDSQVLSLKNDLETGILHGDFNEQNILVRPMKNDPEQYEIFSVIDFGDTQKNALIYELGITIMYMMTQCTEIDPNEAGGHVLAGYETVRPLPDLEKKVLRLCVAARYAQSLVMGAYSYQQDPTNDYLLVTAKTGWKNLRNFWKVSQEDLYLKWDQIKQTYNT